MKELNIEIEHKYSQCGDGCCDYYGYYINVGEDRFYIEDTSFPRMLEEFLNSIGIKATVNEVSNRE